MWSQISYSGRTAWAFALKKHALSGCSIGFKALIRQKSPGAVWTNCMIYRQVLPSKDLNPALEIFLWVIINTVDYVKTRPVKSRMFARFCEEMVTEHTALLFCGESRWLSWENNLTRVFELRIELCQYFKWGKTQQSAHLQWLWFQYAVGIFKWNIQ